MCFYIYLLLYYKFDSLNEAVEFIIFRKNTLKKCFYTS